LGKAIRVTVIATGFEMDRLTGTDEKSDTQKSIHESSKEQNTDENSPDDTMTVINLESGKSEKVKEEPMTGNTFVFSKLSNSEKEKEPKESDSLESKEPSVESSSTPKKDEKPESVKSSEQKRIVYDLFDEDEKPKNQIVEKEQEEIKPPTSEYPKDYYDEIRKAAFNRAYTRYEQLIANRKSISKFEDLKEKLEVPAYLRKKIDLKEPEHSSENNISKFNLSDDNEILGNNRFLHDNVD
jgi:cell division protein FtsZ